MRSSRLCLIAIALGCAVQLCSALSAPPSRSENSYAAAYHYVVCETDHVVSPKSTKDVADAVKLYKQMAAEQGAKLKIRASRHLFHSTTTFVCPNQMATMPSGPESNAKVLSVAVLQDNLNTTVAYDPEKFTMRIGPGMKIRELTAEATRLGMSVQVGSLPAYAGLTIGGIISTSAHGSGDNATSNPCDTLISLTWVDAAGNVRHSKRDTPEVHLFCGGMGLIGIITEIELQMTPPTHTKLITRYLSNDTDIVGDVEKMLKVTPHILVFWRPDLKLYSAYMLKPVSADIPASDAYMTLLPDYKGKLQMAEIFQKSQQDIFGDLYPYTGILQGVQCPLYARNSVFKTWASYRDGKDALYTVAKTNNLVAAECWDNCAWNSPVYDGTAEDVHMSIEWEQFRDWVQDLKNIFKYDVWDSEPYGNGACMGPGYIWLRFGHGGPDYLSMHYDMKRPVYVQSTWLKNRAVMKERPMRYGYVLDLLEEMTLCKYNGRPHWGKNFQRTFTHPKCTIPKHFPQSFPAVLELQQKHDPKAIFEPELWQHIREGKPFSYYPGCAGFDKQCYCKEDIHCPKLHRCVNSLTPGLESYKVCKPDWSKDPRNTNDGNLHKVPW